MNITTIITNNSRRVAPKNQIVHVINECMLSLIPTEEKVYQSFDTPYSVNLELRDQMICTHPNF